MPQNTTIYYNGVEYSSNNYTTEINVLEYNPLSPDPTLKSVETKMYINESQGFVFMYYFTDKHSFSLLDNYTTQYKSTFVGDIRFESNELRGTAYDNKGNYIKFESN